MSRMTPPIELSDEDYQTLLGWTRSGTTEHRMAFRARIILAAFRGQVGRDIARTLDTREATVSKWRRRFHKSGVAGLTDQPRSGKPARYTEATVRSILSCLDEAPPPGYANWTGPLIAQKLGIGVDYVWQVLRKQGISLSRRHSWCLSTDPDFARQGRKHRGPVSGAARECVGAVRGREACDTGPSTEPRDGSNCPTARRLPATTMSTSATEPPRCVAALDVATGLVRAGHFKRRKRRQFLTFMNGIVAAWPDREIHVILDNLRTHKPKVERWLPRHPNVHFHYTPTHASWMNQIEIWFSILWKGALRGGAFQIDTGLATGDGPLHRSLQRERPSLPVEGDQGQTENP